MQKDNERHNNISLGGKFKIVDDSFFFEILKYNIPHFFSY